MYADDGLFYGNLTEKLPEDLKKPYLKEKGIEISEEKSG